MVRFHGATSQAYPKKSFGLTLDAPVRWLGVRESAHWVLNAAFVDRSLMRHKLSYDLFRSLPASNAPRFAAASRFLEVNFNGEYHGVYLLMERVDRAMFELRRYDSNALHHACIYKAVDHGAGFDRLSNHLFDRLLSNAEYCKRFSARWKQLRERQFSVQSICGMIEENVVTLGEAAKRNALRWRTLEGPYPDRLTFEEDLAQMKEWIAARLKWLDQEIDRRNVPSSQRR